MTPLLLLPGSLCDRRLFQPQIESLGMNRTILIGDLSGADNVEAIAQQVLAAAPRRFALAGLSMGGIVAFELWRQAADRIAGLALLDTTYLAERASVAARRGTEIDSVTKEGREGMVELIRARYLPHYLAASRSDDAAVRETVLAMVADCAPETFTRQWRALASRPDSSATLATVDCPALVLCGAEDALCSVEVHQEMARRLGAPCEVLEGCGHLATLEAPQAVSAALARWLTVVERRESKERYATG